ncbi:hypothetical protein [Rickettsiella endosymbiont of Miltochrista miniata]|uniref:ankyrin repeat domain-containing protein n=1 Tax=Rickettsiella endosymbiont of Miltochrista miniata TaxID=3066239 RepID=UPI00313CD7AB
MALLNFHAWLLAPAQKNKTPEELAQLFIESGPDLTNDQDKTLLHYTADEAFKPNYEFRLALLKLLFEQKLDTNAIDSFGRTALHDFAETWDTSWFFLSFDPIAELFFKHGAQFSIKDNEGKTPLDLALQRENADNFLIKNILKFMLLEQPNLTQPSSIDSHERLPEYWNIYKNNIAKLQEQKIPGTECTLYDICRSNNPTQLAKQYYFQHEQIRNFDFEEIKNKFYEYSDRLLVNLKSLQWEIIKIANYEAGLIDVATSLNLNTDIAEGIFKYLSPKECQKMHVAVNPYALFRYKPELTEPSSSQEKTTKSNCCIL